MRIVFAGTPEFSLPCLEKLFHSKHDVIAVYTQPDRPAGRGRQLKASPIKDFSLKNNIAVYQPKTLKDPEQQTILSDLKPDVMIVIAYGLLLPQAILTIPNHGCINVHASLLPRWRGAAPIQRAILAGDAETGVSIMQMTVGLDEGPVYAMQSMPIDLQTNSAQLHNDLANMGAELLLKVLDQLETNTAHAEPQNDSLSCYAKKLNKEEAHINWQTSAVEIARCVNAYNPWPVAYTLSGEARIRIWAAHSENKACHEAPGTIVKPAKQQLAVATGDGYLMLDELQLPGGRRLPVADIINAQSPLLQAGVCLT